MKETKRYKYTKDKNPPGLWSEWMVVTSDNLEDAFKQIGYHINALDPFNSIQLVVAVEGGAQFQVQLDWYVSQSGVDNELAARYIELVHSPHDEQYENVVGPITDENVNNGPKWTWGVLDTFTLDELEKIKNTMQNKLAEIQQQKHTIMANILSLQEMIENELLITNAAQIKEEIE